MIKMQKTKYMIVQNGNIFEASNNGKIVSKTYSEVDSLHSVFVLEGAIKSHFYHSVNNFVYLEIEDEQ